jgi:translation elongation factor EF-G
VAQEAEVAQITVAVAQVFQVKDTTVQQAQEEHVPPVAVVEKVAVEVLGMAEAVQVTLS